jgi:hypothetical protein
MSYIEQLNALTKRINLIIDAFSKESLDFSSKDNITLAITEIENYIHVMYEYTSKSLEYFDAFIQDISAVPSLHWLQQEELLSNRDKFNLYASKILSNSDAQPGQILKVELILSLHNKLIDINLYVAKAHTITFNSLSGIIIRSQRIHAQNEDEIGVEANLESISIINRRRKPKRLNPYWPIKADLITIIRLVKHQYELFLEYTKSYDAEVLSLTFDIKKEVQTWKTQAHCTVSSILHNDENQTLIANNVEQLLYKVCYLSSIISFMVEDLAYYVEHVKIRRSHNL